MTDRPTIVDAVEVRILEPLGGGGFGTVHRGYQPSLDRTVAVKVLRGDLGDDARERLLGEGRIVARMPPHPGIVAVHAVGADGEHAYLVMELVAGGTLEDRLASSEPLEVERILAIGSWLAAALETVHRFGIVHGDVKAANVLLTAAGHPKLADFGVATSLTSPEAGVFTPEVASPERIAGAPPDIASDVYALGRLLARCVERSDPGDRPDAWTALAALAERMTADAAVDRPASMQAVLTELRVIESLATLAPTPAVVLEADADTFDRGTGAGGAPATIDPPSPSTVTPVVERRSPWPIALAVVVAIAVAAAAFATGRATSDNDSGGRA